MSEAPSQDRVHLVEGENVALPKKPSREVVTEAKRLRHEMKVIVASAYIEEIIGRNIGHQCRELYSETISV